MADHPADREFTDFVNRCRFCGDRFRVSWYAIREAYCAYPDEPGTPEELAAGVDGCLECSLPEDDYKKFRAAEKGDQTQVICLAEQFKVVLADWLSRDEWDGMCTRNAAEPNPSVCHSHDFCDANMAMEEALRREGHALFNEDTGAMDAEVQRVWNEAWDYAKERWLS